MGFLKRVRDALTGEFYRHRQDASAPPGDHDVRGQFDYGRPAHGSDPNASYGFENDPNARLPLSSDAESKSGAIAGH
jgi:hypothetical protein